MSYTPITDAKAICTRVNWDSDFNHCHWNTGKIIPKTGYPAFCLEGLRTRFIEETEEKLTRSGLEHSTRMYILDKNDATFVDATFEALVDKILGRLASWTDYDNIEIDIGDLLEDLRIGELKIIGIYIDIKLTKLESL